MRKISVEIHGTEKEKALAKAVMMALGFDHIVPKRIKRLHIGFEKLPGGERPQNSYDRKNDRHEIARETSYDSGDSYIFITPTLSKRDKISSLAHELRHMSQDNSWKLADLRNNRKCENDAYAYERRIKRLLDLI